MREKHRSEFVEAISAQLALRQKLIAVLAHLDSFDSAEQDKVAVIALWIRRHLLQIGALLSADALAISANFAKVRFSEPSTSDENTGYEYRRTVELRLWRFDHEKEIATAMSELEWAQFNGILAGPDQDLDT